MAIEAKVGYLNKVERLLFSEVTAETLAKVMIKISDALEGYEMRETFVDQCQTDDLLDAYIAALKVMGRSPKTIERYEYIIKKMQDFVKVPTRKITVYHLRNYLAHKKEGGLCDKSLEGEREIFSAYFNWLQRESLIEKNPAINLGKIKVPKVQRKIYSEVDFAKLDENCKCSRDRSIIHFLSATGCRISEVMELNRQQIDFDELECTVHGKGNKERTVYLDPVAAMVLQKYLSERTDTNQALFVNRFGKRLDPGGVRDMLKKVAARAGVENVHPHRFRRTKATELSRRGMPIEQIMVLLGHEKIDTTMTYVEIGREDVKHSFKRCS